MKAEKSLSPVLTLRLGVLLAFAVCLLFPFLLLTGYWDVAWRTFTSGENAFGVTLVVETLLVFCILYRTPLLLRYSGRWGELGRVARLILLAHGFVFAAMVTVMILWFLACFLIGIPARIA